MPKGKRSSGQRRKKAREIAMQPRNRRILAAWDRLNDDDISTEKLMAMVSSECDCDNGDVATALAARHEADGGTFL